MFQKEKEGIVTEGQGEGTEGYGYVGVGHLQSSQPMVRNLDLFLCAIENHWIQSTENFN